MLVLRSCLQWIGILYKKLVLRSWVGLFRSWRVLSLNQKILCGCKRYGIKVIDYLNMGHFSFRGSTFQRIYTNMNHNNVDVDYSVLNLLNGLNFSQLNCIISYLICSWIGLFYYLLFLILLPCCWIVLFFLTK